jgi:hypothetical protein
MYVEHDVYSTREICIQSTKIEQTQKFCKYL